MSLGRLMNFCCPDVQKIYHADLMPMLINLMASEEQLKMKAQVVSCAVSFVQSISGSEDEESEEDKEAGKAILM